MKCMNSTSPGLDSDDIKEMNKEYYGQVRIGYSKPCSISSPDSILMELKQAKLNLGLALKPQVGNNGNVEHSLNVSKGAFHNNGKPEQFKQMVDPTMNEVPRSMPLPGNEHSKPCIRTAEMRWIAAKKMEEAAMAAKALAVIEMKGLSSNENSSGFSLPEPEPSPRTPKVQRAEEVSSREAIHAMNKLAEANISKLTILRKLEEASEEVKHSKEALEEALNRVELANRKQLDAEEALRRMIPDQEQKKQVVYNATKINNFPLPHPHPHQHIPRSPLHDLNNQNPTVDDGANPALRPTVSMGDILSKKQVPTKGQTERQKVALSQMLHELREEHLAFSPKPGQKDDQKQYLNQRRKFGFIHISLPLPKQNKKKPQAVNTM
ncbi:hypothetical protein V6Z11_D10G212800 [Gossypium hirsutum]